MKCKKEQTFLFISVKMYVFERPKLHRKKTFDILFDTLFLNLSFSFQNYFRGN